jgi:hypothetical protein
MAWPSRFKMPCAGGGLDSDGAWNNDGGGAQAGVDAFHQVVTGIKIAAAQEVLSIG